MLSFTPQSPVSIIPAPAQVEIRVGSFTLTSSTTIVAGGTAKRYAKQLQGYLQPATALDLPLANAPTPGSIVLRLDPQAGQGPEGYVLSVMPHRVDLSAQTPAGLFYGIQTIRQLLPAEIFRRSKVTGARWTMPSVIVRDQPRFGWRGAHMDVSRHFMPKEFILKFLDLMALHKLNVFHWHLTDDMGWRVEIKKFPKLTSAIGSGTDYSEMNPAGATRSVNQRPGGYYTQDDVREIVRYAADRQITVLPEIEMPGHSLAIIKAYPEWGNMQQTLAAGADAKHIENWDNVFNVDDSTISAIKQILDEVLALFPSKFIHIGGDEVWKDPWKKNPRAQEKMKALGLKNEEELQSWFIRQFDAYLLAKKRRLIGWDEILEGGLAPNAAVMSWRGEAGGIAAAKAGHDVVMAPNDQTYFDHYQSRFTDKEPKAIGGFTSLQEVYGYEPIPKELTPEEGKRVLGAQAQLWSEFIPHPKHMEYMAYPRLSALSEVVWSPKASRNYENFLGRMESHFKRLDVLDVNYRRMDPAGPDPVGGWKSGETSESWAVKEWDLSQYLKAAGDYDLLFLFSGGGHRLDIEWVELVENGQPISRDEHPGRAGGEHKDNRYKLSLKQVKPGAKYVVRANVRSDGGNDSNGDIYLFRVR